MEKHIYKKSIQFFCLQPININKIYFEKLLNKPIELDNDWVPYSKFKQEQNDNNSSDFVKLFDILKHSFRNQDMWIHSISPETFHSDLSNIPEPVCFSHSKQNSGFFLICDRNNKMFMLVSCLDYHQNQSINDKHLHGISESYQKIRNYFNVDPQQKNYTVGTWVDQINNWASSVVNKVLPWLKTDDINIIPNTGYIIVNWNKTEFTCSFDNLKKHILQNNHNEDTAMITMDNLDKEEHSFAFYGWRYTTLFNLNNNNISYSLSILCMHQMLYFIFHFVYQEITTIAYEDIRHRNNVKLEKQLNLFDTIITSFKSHQYYLLRYVSNLNKWQFEIYENIYQYWNLENDIRNYEEILSIMKETLNRRLSMQESKEEKTQSNVLFILAIIGIFSLISIFYDFATWCDSKVPEIFKDSISESSYNASKQYILPVLIGISLMLIVIAYKNKILSVLSFITGKLRFHKR
ncbi:MAG: hypothetical protein JEY96_03275 [Bacteroidales bacterium]|nr:hypothetical protein [Bacteroidales bacterium]